MLIKVFRKVKFFKSEKARLKKKGKENKEKFSSGKRKLSRKQKTFKNL